MNVLLATATTCVIRVSFTILSAILTDHQSTWSFERSSGQI